jgi:alkaline phosphatase D
MAIMSRRAFLSSVALAGASVLAGGVSRRGPWTQGIAPALVTADSACPSIPYGVASGDVTSDAATIWSRTNKPSRMLVEYTTTDSFANAQRAQGPAALAVSDFTARVELTDLPAGQEIFYRVMFQDLADLKTLSAPVLGHFRTAPAQRRDILFVWGGDTAGQGWGINPEWGGMRLYEQMRRLQPDFFHPQRRLYLCR